MPAFNKHSLVEGSIPNLVPGSIGVNLLDETFHLRADGRVVSISIPKWRDRAATRQGAQVDAPLLMTPDGPAWSPALAPSSVVGGLVRVDEAPPLNHYAIPGVQITGAGADAVFSADTVTVERFYVASDAILLDRVAFMLKFQNMTAPIRVGVVDDANVLMDQVNIAVPFDGALNTASFSLALSRGFYKLVLWSQSPATFGTLDGLQTDQGWALDGGGDPVFVSREQGVAAGMVTGIDLSLATLTPQTQPTPGVNRLLSMRWSVPA